MPKPYDLELTISCRSKYSHRIPEHVTHLNSGQNRAHSVRSYITDINHRRGHLVGPTCATL
jgi:hypothetical protein